MKDSSPSVGLAVVFAVPLMLWAGPIYAFHEGGVGSCSGCHVMHNSKDGLVVAPGGPYGAQLLAETSSEVCLSCHANANGDVFGVDPLVPPPERGGGNFVFLLEDNLNDAPGGHAITIGGNHAGHSIVAPGSGLFADPDYLTAPGGSYPSSQLSCTSCHDPHGNGEYLMLHGQGATVVGGFVFGYSAPQGEGPALGGSPESPSNHTAYIGGWTQWCANCHGYYHDAGSSDFEHPVTETLESDHRTTYDEYNGSADPTGGISSTAYLPEVPFEDPASTVSSTAGPSAASEVSCMSCHRAHASSAPHAGRWDFYVHRLGDDGLMSGSYPIPNPYADPNQRSLCLKCHYSDAHGHGMNAVCLKCHSDSGGGGGPQPVGP